jgi:hypothetical protein
VEELLPMWTEIDLDDALELLGPGTVDSRVRAFAVRQLNRADDDVRSLKGIILASHTPLTTGTNALFASTCTGPQI